MTAYNAAATIDRALTSCLKQDYPDHETVVVNDGSTDATQLIIDQYKDHPNLRPFHLSENFGVVEARNYALSQTSSEYIAVLDADDWADPMRISEQVKAMEQNPDWDLCKTLVELENPLGKGMQRYVDWVNSLSSPKDVLRERFIESPIIQPSVLIKKSAFKKVGFYQKKEWGEDYDLWLRMLDHNMQCGTVKQHLVKWLDREDCLTRRDDSYSKDSFLQAKAHYFAKIPNIKNKQIFIAGAGPTGKALSKYLSKEGLSTKAFLDVHPRRIGKTANSSPVLSYFDQYVKDLLIEENHTLLIASGGEHVRLEIKEWADQLGLSEGKSYWCMC